MSRIAALSLILSASWLPALAQNNAIASAEAAYNAGEFERAVGLFSAVADEPGAGTDNVMLAYHYLARVYAAMHMNDEAKSAIGHLLDREPPLVVFDPDGEPPPVMNLYYEVRKERGGYSVEAQSGKIQTIAVIDFTNGSIGSDVTQYDALSVGLASMMINFLGGATDLKVIERERLQWLLNELNLQKDSTRVDQQTAVKAGRLLGAQSVLIGSFIVNGEDVYLGSRLVKVETGEILIGEQLFGKQAEIFDLIKRLSAQTAESINVSLSDESLDVPEGSGALDALMAYSKGLQLLEEAEYEAASGQFERALSLDPDYAQAAVRLETLQPILNGIAQREQ